MHCHVKTNALICLIKRLAETHFGGIQATSVATRNSATLLQEPSLLYFDISLTTKLYYYKYQYRTGCIITSSTDKSRSYIHIIMSCCEREFPFLSVPTHSRLPSQSARSTFYVSNPSPLGYNTIFNDLWPRTP
jgi:hypothetical protein